MSIKPCKASPSILFFWFILIVISSCNTENNFETVDNIVPDSIVHKLTENYKFALDRIPDTLFSIEGKIGRNQFLSEILENHGITNSEIDQVARNSRQIFDVRKMRAGAPYTILKGVSDSTRALYMIYEHDPVTYYILDFTDSLHLREESRNITWKLKYSSGSIETSLWNSIIESGTNPTLAVELSEIYAWSVDFFGLQVGDRYKVIYEEEFIDTISVGIRKVYGAWFQHAGQEFYAIPIIQDSIESYFDIDGKSLRKAFLKAPLRFSRISSRFSNSRMHPILRIRRPHHGVDYAAPIGTPVVAIGDGKVIMAEYQSGSGRIVKVKHNSVYTTAYMHLSRFGPGVKVGTYLNQGDIVGYVGSSGLSTGPHLDFRFYKNGAAVDPLKVEAPSVDPIKDENMEKFNKISSLIKDLLDSIE
jgi:murein DD-endopeptidase MepM/ murein hydrolase activator NlpD